MQDQESKNKVARQAVSVVERFAVVLKDAAESDGLNDPYAFADVLCDAFDALHAPELPRDVRLDVKRAAKAALKAVAVERAVLIDAHSRETERFEAEIRRLKEEARQKENAVPRRVVKGIIGVVALIFSAFWAWNGDAKGATIALAFVAYIWGEEIPWRSLARFFAF